MKLHPIEETSEWKRMTKQAMREAKESLDRTPRHLLDRGNPNHPCHDQLFGYDRDVFMAKQYR